jgi:hypothetical protein
MVEQLVQLRSKKQPGTEPLPISLPSDVPSSFWIYRMKIKILILTFFYALRSRHPWASVHRYFVSILTPESIQKRSKSQLQGECNRCGHCCRIHFNCPFLHTEPDGLTHCTIYLTRHAPKVCVVFPLDPADLAEIKRSIEPATCSFDFSPDADMRLTLKGALTAQFRRLFDSKRV